MLNFSDDQQRTGDRAGPVDRKLFLLPILMLVLCLVPWLLVVLQAELRADLNWQFRGVERLWRGETFSQGIYDNNLPLSVLVYMPTVFLSHITGLSSVDANIAATLFYSALSALAVFKLARCLVAAETALCLALGLILAGTVPFMFDFGQREELLMFGMLPFVFGQIVLTNKIPCSRVLLWAVFLVGAVLILIKPYYALIPSLLLLHRMITQKRFWSIMKDADFIALAVATVAYPVLVWIYFPDFIEIILPDILVFHAFYFQHFVFCLETAVCFLFGYAGFFAFHRKMPGREGKLVRLLLLAAAACLILYVLASREWYYHLIPTLMFFGLALILIAFRFFQRRLPARTALMAAIFSISVLGYTLPQPLPTMRADVAAQPFTKILRDCGDCSFFVFEHYLNFAEVTASHLNKDHATRFSSFWFLRVLGEEKFLLSRGLPAHIAWQEYFAYYHRFANNIAEDLRMRKPDMAIVCDNVDYIGYFLQNSAFAQEWAHYKKTDSFISSRAFYYFVPWHPYYLSKYIQDTADPERFKNVPCSVFRRKTEG